MAFTTELKTGYPQPQGELMEEIWDYTNTGGDSGGTITTRYIKNIQAVSGNYLDETRTATTVAIVTDVNASGSIIIRGV